MNKLYTQMMRLSILVSLYFASGCAAASYPQSIAPVDPGATIRGMQAAVNGAQGTFILQRGKDLVMGWPSGTQYAWIAITANGRIADTVKNVCGNRACPQLAGELYNYLEANGWQPVNIGAIPPAVCYTIRQFAYLLSIGESLPMIPVLVVPMTPFDAQKFSNPQMES